MPHTAADRHASPRVTRSQALVRVRQRLLAGSHPRLHMALIVALTGGMGLLSSAALLHAGIDRMAWRYPLALALAYGFFLCAVWLWLRTRREDWLDMADLSGLPTAGSGRGPASPVTAGGGGDFGGAGAGDSFGEAIGTVAEADGLALPLVVLAAAAMLALGLVAASAYLVYLAPSLLAELLLDGALSYTLYRHLRGLDRRHWLGTALRRTAGPFAVAALFVAAGGTALSAWAPGARTLGDVLQHRSQASATTTLTTTTATTP